MFYTKYLHVSLHRCWSSDSYNPVPGVMPNVPSSRQYAGGFGVGKLDIAYWISIVAHLLAHLLTHGRIQA